MGANRLTRRRFLHQAAAGMAIPAIVTSKALGQGDVPDVVLEVEVAIPDPPGPVEPERHIDEPLPEALGDVQARFDVLQHLLVGDRLVRPGAG